MQNIVDSGIDLKREVGMRAGVMTGKSVTPGVAWYWMQADGTRRNAGTVQ